MKALILLVVSLCFCFSTTAQKKTKIILGIDYRGDTVTILYNFDTLFHSIVESDFNAHVTKEFEFVRKKQNQEFLRVYIK